MFARLEDKEAGDFGGELSMRRSYCEVRKLNDRIKTGDMK
jgi:hypothetical protein